MLSEHNAVEYKSGSGCIRWAPCGAGRFGAVWGLWWWWSAGRGGKVCDDEGIVIPGSGQLKPFLAYVGKCVALRLSI